MMVGNEVPALVDVRISGPRTLLMNLQPNDIRIAVNLKDLQPGLTSFKRLEERLNLPTALKVTRLSPAFVDVKLERVMEKKVPVQPVLMGTPDDGYRVASIKAEPSHVTVEGAESEVKEVNEITTEPIAVEGAKETFTLTVPLVYRGKFTALKDHESAEVQVTIVPISAETSALEAVIPAAAEDNSRRIDK
jgi:YbbR domain-containing protein